jgi:sucrose-phosphate synthase
MPVAKMRIHSPQGELMKKQATITKKRLYIVLISVHGLIRGHDLELGRDADTGGQTKYVVELARALGERADVEKVVLLTRGRPPGQRRLRPGT